MTSARWLITSQLTFPSPLRRNEQQITQQPACPLRDAANTLLNPSLINHTRAGDTFPRRAIARIDVIIADSLFMTVATMLIFLERWRRWILHRSCRSIALITTLFSLSRFFPSTVINKCQCSNCYRGRPRNEMWNENAGSEWRPKLGYARLRLRLKERARESIIFRESWPGERFRNLTVPERENPKIESLNRKSLISFKINLQYTHGSFYFTSFSSLSQNCFIGI